MVRPSVEESRVAALRDAYSKKKQKNKMRISITGSTLERRPVGVRVPSRTSRRVVRRTSASSRVGASRREDTDEDDEDDVVDSFVGSSMKDGAAAGERRSGDSKTTTATRSTLDALGAVLEREGGGKARGAGG
jgi:hypothetical protein